MTLPPVTIGPRSSRAWLWPACRIPAPWCRKNDLASPPAGC